MNRRELVLMIGGLGAATAGCVSSPSADELDPTDKVQILSTSDLVWTQQQIYWSSIIKASKYITDPINDYYLYYSENHVDGSRIGLATAPSPTGPFLDYGPVYKDQRSDSQTETPSVIWNEATNKLHLYYHGNYGGGSGSDQSTALAISSDGLNWSRYGVVIDVPTYAPGNGHTGYFRPRKLDRRWHGYHLIGGTDYPVFGWSWSDDGKHWDTNWPLSAQHDLTGRSDLRIEWTHSNLVQWDGVTWWIGALAPYESGANPGVNRTISISRMDPQSGYTRLMDSPRTLIEATEYWETDTIRIPDVYINDETLYVYYTTNSSIAVAEFEYPGLFEKYRSVIDN